MNTSNKSDANVARQIAQAVIAFHEKRTDHAPTSVRVVLADPTQAMSCSSLRVAVADADRRMRQLVQQMLRNLEYEVVAAAENGASLIKQCVSVNPDVVIAGTLTPDMNGADAAAIIFQLRPIPIILYSDDCDRDLVLNAEHKHVFMYLVKPLSQEYLKLALEGCWCQESRGLSGDNDGDEDTVFVGTYPGYSGTTPYRGPSRPPCASAYRPAREGQDLPRVPTYASTRRQTVIRHASAGAT